MSATFVRVILLLRTFIIYFNNFFQNKITAIVFHRLVDELAD